MLAASAAAGWREMVKAFPSPQKKKTPSSLSLWITLFPSTSLPNLLTHQTGNTRHYYYLVRSHSSHGLLTQMCRLHWRTETTRVADTHQILQSAETVFTQTQRERERERERENRLVMKLRSSGFFFLPPFDVAKVVMIHRRPSQIWLKTKYEDFFF